MTQPFASSAPDPADIRRLFARIVESPRDQWAAMVQRIEDASVRRDVQALLDAHAKALDKGFMSSPTGPAGATTATGPISEQPGTRIGPYKLLEIIGEGGFGVVFMAEQHAPVRRRVALKIIKLGMDTRQVVARFEQERQALALMDHPHIARVFDAGATDSGSPYFVMEYVVGEPITKFASHRRLTLTQRLELFTQVCAAVQHAHMKGLIHRDLKPGNVLVSMTDGKPFAKVIDFGIAKATSGGALTEKTLFTEHRQLIGTPEYMSPEQAEGSPDIDTRSDVYALGVVLYELLTGLTPFDGARLRSAAFAEMQRIIREEEPPAPSIRVKRNTNPTRERGAAVALAMQPALGTSPSSAPSAAEPQPSATPAAAPAEPATPFTPHDLQGELDWIVMKALEKDRARRYETPNQLAADVQRHLSGEPIQAAPPSAAYRLRKFVRRNKGPVLLASTIVAVVIVAGTSVTVFAQRAVRASVREAQQAAIAKANLAEAQKQAGYVLDAAAFAQCGGYDAAEGCVGLFRPLTPAAARHMSRLPGFVTCRFTADFENLDQTLRVLADPDRRYQALTSLDLNDVKVTDEGLKELARADTGLKALTGLYLASTKVTDAGLKDLARADTGLKALTALYLGNTAVTDAGLKDLARADTGLKALTELDLGSTKVTDAGLKELARVDTGLKALTLLELNYTAVTDAGVKELARVDTGLKALTLLDLNYTAVTDAGVKELARADTGLKALASLNLQNTNVTDAGLKELARADTGLKALTSLDLHYTQVTDAGVAAVKTRWPGIKVDR